MTREDIENDCRREDNEMLVRRFVGNVGYDYIQHHKKNTSNVHPDFSDETRIVWEEIEESRHMIHAGMSKVADFKCNKCGKVIWSDIFARKVNK